MGYGRCQWGCCRIRNGDGQADIIHQIFALALTVSQVEFCTGDKHSCWDGHGYCTAQQSIAGNCSITRQAQVELELAAITEFDFHLRDFAVGHAAFRIDIRTQHQRTAINHQAGITQRLLELASRPIRIALEHKGAVSGVREGLARFIALELICFGQVGLFTFPAIRELVAISIKFKAAIG